MLTTVCCLCINIGSHLCGKCHNVRYCSREHQKDHWKVHKINCFPCRIEVTETLGRYLVATKDICAGETIISDLPLVVGPQYGAKPVCLGCNDPVNGKYTCDDCGFLLCSANCPNKINHRRECQLIKRSGKRAKIASHDQMNPIYQCITPLRCLWMKTEAHSKWDALMDMEAHLEQRKEGSHRYNEVQNFIVSTIVNYFEMDNFSEDEIQKSCGILETNGFEVPGMNLVSLYAFGFLLEHSCIPNTTRTFDSRLNLIVIASVDIKAGDHISTSYVNPFWGERVRNAHLKNFKYFTCKCFRCSDPTDLNTHLSSIRCKSCESGLLVPPDIVTSEWKCDNCVTLRDAQEIEKELVDIFQQKQQIPQTITSIEKFLKRTRRMLSENHQFRVEAKLVLLQMYGNDPRGKTESKSSEEIARKRLLCKDVLEVANLFSPGLSRVRGIILYELHSTYTEEFRRLHKKFRATPEAVKLLQIAEDTLSEAVTILKLETHLHEEMSMVDEGEIRLGIIHKWKKNATKNDFNNKNKTTKEYKR